MKGGDPVEVKKVWAFARPDLLRSWFTGYTFVRREDRSIIVRASDGVFAGCESRWPETDVRASR